MKTKIKWIKKAQLIEISVLDFIIQRVWQQRHMVELEALAGLPDFFKDYIKHLRSEH